MRALVVFEDGHWLRIVGDEVLSRGRVIDDALPLHEEEAVAAIVPARDVIVRDVVLPDLSDVQANAAARIAVAEASIAEPGSLHVVAGRADETGQRLTVSVEASRVTQRLLDLAAVGLDPDHLLAAPLMLPRPEIGFVRAEIGDETVLRGRDSAFADDIALTPILTQGSAVETLDRSAIEQAIVAALRLPEADLRQGVFAKRRQWLVERARLRRLVVMLLILGVAVLLTQIVAVVRMNATAQRIEADNRIQAAAILPPGTVITDPALQTEARLTAVSGAGGGFVSLAGAIAQVVEGTPGVELGALIYEGDGALRATVRATNVADLDNVAARLTALGLAVTPSPLVDTPGRPYRDLTVRAR